MARAFSATRQAEYARDKAFVFSLVGIVDAAAAASPAVPRVTLSMATGLAATLAEMEARSPALAHRGLLMARNDLLEMTRDFGPDRVRAVDAALRDRDLPTLSAVRAATWKTIPKVLQRGRIRSEAEYYLVVERVNDVSEDDGLSVEARAGLGEMVAEFEARKAKPRGGAV